MTIYRDFTLGFCSSALVLYVVYIFTGDDRKMSKMIQYRLERSITANYIII